MTFTMPVKPRYMEVDVQGVVFNGWYLTWFDEAMGEYLDHIGWAYPVLIESGYDVKVVHSEIDYQAGVRWGDSVEVAVATGHVGTSSFALDFQVRRGAEVCITCRNVYVVVAADFSGKRPIPDTLRAALGAPTGL